MGRQELGEAGATFPRDTHVSRPGCADLAGGGAPYERTEESLPQAKPEANFSAGIRCTWQSGQSTSEASSKPPSTFHPGLGQYGVAGGSHWALLSHAQCPAPPSGKKAANLPVPAHPNASKEASGNLLSTQKHVCHPPHGPLRGQNGSGHPDIHPKGQLDGHVHSPGPSQVSTLPGKAACFSCAANSA